MSFTNDSRSLSKTLFSALLFVLYGVLGIICIISLYYIYLVLFLYLLKDDAPLKKLDGRPIQNVVSDKGTSYLDIHFKDGSHMSVPKEQIYFSITQGGATHESL